MNQPANPAGTSVEVDVRALFRTLLRAAPYIVVFAIIAAVGAYYGLSKIAPQYLSETTLLIESGESSLTRDAGDPSATVLDEQAITSQVQLIKSRDLARTVASKLHLDALPEFDKALKKPSFLGKLLARFGLARSADTSSVEERVLDAYNKKLQVYAIDKSRVIAVDFTSNDPDLAANVANAVAQEYLALQRAAKRDTTADATTFLQNEIDDLRVKVQAAETKVANFRADNDLFTTGQNATSLPEQQLGDLNAELTKVRAAEADSEAKAAQIRNAIASGATATISDVLNSQLIQRLVESQVALRAQMAQLSATLLPEHPRMKELAAQIANLDQQITAEAKKVLDSVDSDAKLAKARMTELQASLDRLKTVSAKANDAQVQLNALEREAAAQRDLLDSYLRRYRDALARQNGDYLPADARVISKATPAVEPNFPKKGPMTAVATIAALVLAIAFVLIRELTSGRPMRRVAFGEPLPLVPDARPVGGHLRWADDHSVRRIMPSEPTLAPELVDRAEASLSTIAREITEARTKRVLVTLADGSDVDGRPLAAVSLARAIARTDARVVLVDLNDDDADCMTMAEETNLPGFSDLFAGDASFAQVIFRDRKSRVHLIPSGRERLRGGEIDSARLDTILDALDHTYDYVIVDAANDMLEVFGPSTGVAVVVSEFGAADPRTVRAFDRITAVSSANILLLVVDPTPASAVDEPADVATPTGAAA